MAFHHTGGFFFRDRRSCRHSLSSNLAILIISLWLLAGSASGQSYVSISAGTAVPVGNFALQEYPEGGFALPGATVSADGAWFFNPQLGIGGKAGYYANPVEVAELAVEKMKAEPFFLNLVIRSDPYRIFYFTPGVYYRLPISEDFEAVFNVKGGASYSISPYQLYKAEYFLIGTDWSEITSAKSWSWVAGAEGQVSWDMSNSLALVASAGMNFMPVEWRFLRSNGTYRYQSHEVMMIHLELGVKAKIGAGKINNNGD